MKRGKKYSQPVWLYTCLLVVLVGVTAAVLGTCLYRFVHRSDYSISLYKGQINKNVAQGSSTGSTTVVYTGEKAQTQAKKYDFNVKDSKHIWSTETAVELFKISYANENGDITVRSAGKDKVIAPGTEGSYTFDLKNTGTKTADYKVWVETRIDSKITGMPLQTRMSGADGWLLGGKNEWKQASDLDGISTEEELDAGKSAEYVIYWQWPFEQGTDEMDTNLGNLTVNQQLTYTVIIHTLATESTKGSAGGTGETTEKKDSVLSKIVKTGDTSHILMWSIILAAAAVMIFLVLFRRKREK